MAPITTLPGAPRLQAIASNLIVERNSRNADVLFAGSPAAVTQSAISEVAAKPLRAAHALPAGTRQGMGVLFGRSSWLCRDLAWRDKAIVAGRAEIPSLDSALLKHEIV